MADPIKGIARATDFRITILSIARDTAANDMAPQLTVGENGMTNALSDRQCRHDEILQTGVAVASGLVMANMNSIPFDWSARQSVGGARFNHYTGKQLPVLSPDIYRQYLVQKSLPFVDLNIPRVLELVYTSRDVLAFAHDLGYVGPPFTWNGEYRSTFRCELDAIYALLYGLERSDLGWILESKSPSLSFAIIKQREMNHSRSIGRRGWFWRLMIVL